MAQDRKGIVTLAGLAGLQVGRREQVSVEDCQNESPGWVWLALVPRERIGGLLLRGGEIKGLSSRQFGNPLMYCGVSIHATWTASSEGPAAGVGTGLAEGVPLEGVLQSGDL